MSLIMKVCSESVIKYSWILNPQLAIEANSPVPKFYEFVIPGLDNIILDAKGRLVFSYGLFVSCADSIAQVRSQREKNFTVTLDSTQSLFICALTPRAQHLWMHIIHFVPSRGLEQD